MSKSVETKIPILSFFSGGGFMDMGFEQAGFEVVWSNEFDEIFAELHTAGMTSWRKSQGNQIKAEIFNTESITEISSDEILKEAFPSGKVDPFGIIGGPPCQDFSINGSKNGFNGDRGMLTQVFLDRIHDLKPDFFVIENVTGLVRIKSNYSFFKNLLERISENYLIDSEILNALSFGVPQSRERVFFVGFKKNTPFTKDMIQEFFRFPFFDLYKNDNLVKKYNWPGKNAFGSTPIKDSAIPDELCVERCLVNDDAMDLIPNANEFFPFKVTEEKLNGIEEGETNRPSFKRLHRYRYSPTTCYGNNEVHLHPYKNRRISVREALRIQGVSDHYILPPEISKSKKFKMIGNGVPVPMAKALAYEIKKFINND